MNTRLTTVEDAINLNLREDEFEMIKEIMGRVPNINELSVYSAMWSEHCSYKNSIKYLKTLPKKGDHLLVEAGEENAGLVDVGNGIACAFKIESHNHPSAVEPYQGAATGVGGINRDIFTMGARPIAQMNSLRFGLPGSKRTKWLVDGVSKGIGDYGNSFGVPTVGGEVYFEESYEQNPLVNAFSAGIINTNNKQFISAKASGVGNPIFIFGSSTGKDGINGASFASKDLTESSSEDIPAVQVGDPFQEKLLLEASLELSRTDHVVGMQDMGAAGITCSTAEMSAAGEVGMHIHLDKVPLRQKNMEPWEILLSESQERMLAEVKKGHEAEVIKIFEKWDIHAECIGEVVEGDELKFFWNGEVVADVSPHSLVLGGGAPVYDREYKEPAYFEQLKAFDIQTVKDIDAEEIQDYAEKIIQLPNVASKEYITRQYDSSVGTINMGNVEPSAAAVVNIKQNNSAIAMSVDCNSRYVFADPKQGTMMAVSEAARNIVCSGGKPSAITNCLNFGNPYDPEAYWQFVNAIAGMKEACEAFGTPVTGGNVSFYNQTVIQGKATPVYPTPTIGMIGLLEDKQKRMTLGFKQAKRSIYVLGNQVNDISCSEYLRKVRDFHGSPAPYFNLELETSLHKNVLNLIDKGLIESAHDVSEGGLMTALLEKAFIHEIGFDVLDKPNDLRLDAFLFGEAQGRVIVTVENEAAFEAAIQDGLAVFKVGETNDQQTVNVLGQELNSVATYKSLYKSALHNQLSQIG